MKKIIRILNMERGFTLIEVIISLAIFSILSLSLMGIMINFSAQTGKTQRQITTLENARIVLEFMIDETRRAEGIQIDNLSGRQILALEMNGLPGIDISAPNPDVVFEFDSSEKKVYYNGVVLSDNIESINFVPSSIVDADGKIHPDLDINKDDLIDESLKIEIKALIPQDDHIKSDVDYTITGEISIRYKKILTN
ncbi:MAG: type II secretion system protein [Epulopiscium sp.]|jgi:prepilin-type N-terminal cleavage/methylation domain-containing protein|nr:type II secretion system protein [Candidatus Epulonipiscium sp.]